MTFFSLIQSYVKKIVFIFVCILLSNVLSLALPWGIKILIDDVFLRSDLDLLNVVIFGLLGVLILRSCLNFLRQYYSHVTGEKIICRLRGQIYDKVYKISLGKIKELTPSQILTRMTGDLDSLRKFLFGEAIEFVYAFFATGFILIALLLINFKLTTISLLTFPLFIKIYTRLLPQLKINYRSVRNVWGQLTSRISEVLNGMATVRAFTGESFEKRQFWKQQENLIQTSSHSHALNAKLWMCVEFFSSLGILAILWVGGMDVITARMTAGELVAFYSYLGMLFSPLIRMVVIHGSYQEASAALERINEILNIDDDHPQEEGLPKIRPDIKGSVEFRNVSFNYSKDEETLHDLSFRVRQGETIGVVGSSGAGKTTILNLLLGFYHSRRGEVVVDQKPLEAFDRNAYHRQVAVVLQDDYLFSGSIQDNICYGQSEINPVRMRRAAKAACVDEFIDRLPEGYLTKIGERGSGLSSGQRQRIAIARALLRDPAILVLDEATSAIDALTENKIQKSICQWMYGKTVFIVAHRFSTIMEADKIIVIDKGEIVESGDHNYLLNKGGFYSNLYVEQFMATDKEHLHL